MPESELPGVLTRIVKMHEVPMKNNEDKIIDAFKKKDWQEIISSDSWKIFKIMSEFVEGFEKLARIGPCVSIFGSARTTKGHPDYETARKTAACFAGRISCWSVGHRDRQR